MSTEHYIVCDECKTKVHIGCHGLGGVQFWSGEEWAMKNLHSLIKNCFMHFDKLKFVYENSTEAEEYVEQGEQQ